jgi:hypothetical protein
MPSPDLTATVTVSPGAAELLCRTELPKISLTSKMAASRHGCPEPSTSETNARATRARSARPASVTLSLTATLAITAPALPRPPCPGKSAGQRADAGTCTLSSTANVKPTHTVSAAPCPWPVRRNGPVRGRPCKADGSPHRSQALISSAIRPWTPQHSALQRYKVTHAGQSRNGPPSREFPASGPFSQVVA